MIRKTITITAVVDVVGALAAEALSGNFYMLDTNRVEGSSELGTEHLKTKVVQGDRLVWNALALECEAYVAIEAIYIDPQFCEPKKEFYLGTDIIYWVATVKKTPCVLPYQLSFCLGTRRTPIKTCATPTIIGS
jgi:hypothetical protein